MKQSNKFKKPKKVITVVSLTVLALSLILLVFATIYNANNTITLFGYRFYYITTGSMEPDIRQGSFVAARSVSPDELKIGDVISFVSSDPDIEGQINTHAIYDIDEDADGNLIFMTKGTANSDPDEYLVYENAIRGKVVFKSYAIGCAYGLLSNRTVSFCITIIPLAAIVIIYFVDLVVAMYRPYPDEEQSSEKTVGDDKDQKKQ